ncbi:hypothetical protein MTP03_03540 [Tsukamurella sp. PLM1]|nr:hypothetical protein MTP03_03540 [Tsukamurella sp. PLM1]
MTDSAAAPTETPVTPAPSAPAEPAAQPESDGKAPSAPETPADQPKATTGGSDRTLATEGESKAKGFGIAAGAKRPGGRK